MTSSFWLRHFGGFHDFLSLLNQIQLFFGGGSVILSEFFFILYTLFYFISYPYQSKFSLSFFVPCDPVSSYRFALCFAVAKLIFKREAALWNPVLFFLSAKLLYGFLCFFLICNGHCCQTQAKKCQFKDKVTSRSIRF